MVVLAESGRFLRVLVDLELSLERSDLDSQAGLFAGPVGARSRGRYPRCVPLLTSKVDVGGFHLVGSAHQGRHE